MKRPDTLNREAFKAWWEPQVYGKKDAIDYSCEAAAWAAWQAVSRSEIRLLTPALKGEIADNIDPENRTATDLVQDVWDELAERGLVGATVRESGWDARQLKAESSANFYEAEYERVKEEMAVFVKAWPLIDKALTDYAIHIHIRGGSLQPIPEIVEAKQLYESITSKIEDGAGES